jgi:hypothetical protein
VSVDLASRIVDVPELPRPGIACYDITPLLASPTGPAATGPCDRPTGHGPTVVAALLTLAAR